MDMSILNLSIVAAVISGGFTQACQQRGSRNCGQNAFYCYDEFTENWECQCELGFENTDPNRGPQFSCTDINECLIHQHNCGENTWCSNFDGGFHCLCIDGFTNLRIHLGNAVCSDVNECEMNPRCPENSICFNTAGSYNCTCGPGFSQGNGFCYDINECEALGPNLCGGNGACVNTIGSFTCQCSDGSVNDTCPGEITAPTDAGVTPPDNVLDTKLDSDLGPVKEKERDGNVNETDSRLSELEPENTSVFIGVGVGLGLVLVGCIFAVGYVIFVKKRRRENRTRSHRADRSQPKTTASTGDTASQIDSPDSGTTPNDKKTSPKEHQYYTIHPDTEAQLTHKSPTEIKAMYSNCKINKKKAETSQDAGPDLPTVYQIFDGPSGMTDEGGNPGVRICSADPKRLPVPLTKQPSTGVLNYATIFENNKTDAVQSVDYPYSEVLRTSPMSSPPSGQDRKLVKISPPGHYSSTYDRLDRPVFKEQPKGEYHKLYSHPNSPTQERQLRKISPPERRSVLAPYEVVNVPSDS